MIIREIDKYIYARELRRDYQDILVVPIFIYYAVCLGGEEAVLKTVGSKGLARSNRVHGVIYPRSSMEKEYAVTTRKAVGSIPIEDTIGN